MTHNKNHDTHPQKEALLFLKLAKKLVAKIEMMCTL